jgi:hypothetical protein
MKCCVFTALFGDNDFSTLLTSLTSQLPAKQADLTAKCSGSVLGADLSPEAGSTCKPISIK